MNIGDLAENGVPSPPMSEPLLLPAPQTNLASIVAQLKHELKMVNEAIKTFERLEMAICNVIPIKKSGRRSRTEEERRKLSEIKKRYWAEKRTQKKLEEK